MTMLDSAVTMIDEEQQHTVIAEERKKIPVKRKRIGHQRLVFVALSLSCAVAAVVVLVVVSAVAKSASKRLILK